MPANPPQLGWLTPNTPQLPGGARWMCAAFFGQADDGAASLFLPLRYSESVFLLAWKRKCEFVAFCCWFVEINILMRSYLFVAELLFPSLANKLGRLKRCGLVSSALRSYVQVTVGTWIYLICKVCQFVRSAGKEIPMNELKNLESCWKTFPES